MKSLRQSEPDALRWYQYRLRTLFIAFVVVAVPLGLYCGWARRYDETQDLTDQILATVDSLEAKRPGGMTQLQWETAIYWTRNLVCNSLKPVEDDLDELRRFQTELQEKAEGDVDFCTILWIWDQFARLTDAGKKYQYHRQHMLEEIRSC